MSVELSGESTRMVGGAALTLVPDWTEDTEANVPLVGNARPGLFARTLALCLTGTSGGLGYLGYLEVSRMYADGIFASLGWYDYVALVLGDYLALTMGAVILGLTTALSLHYAVLGPKIFNHGGESVTVFSRFCRTNHWVAAVSCTVLMLTGFAIIIGGTAGLEESFGGSESVLVARKIHAVSTLVFLVSVIFMFFGWVSQMLPKLHDLRWLAIGGGYLSRKKLRIPAHKFNAGQKMWFWLATCGGVLMAATGVTMFFLLGSPETLTVVAIVHHAMAVALVTMFLIHVYMAVFAIKGSLGSMVNGQKSADELDTLHSLYYEELNPPEEFPGLASVLEPDEHQR